MKPSLVVLALALVALVTGCLTTPPPEAPPSLVSTNPSQNATDVAVGSTVRLEFSKAINPASLTLTSTPSFDWGSAIWQGDKVAVFDPLTDLALDTLYTLSIAAKDKSGVALANNPTLAFKTAKTIAPPPPNPSSSPTIAQVLPFNGSVQVPINTALQVTFSKPMNPSTVQLSLQHIPNPSQPPRQAVSLSLGSPRWFANNTILEIKTNADLPKSARIELTVSGQDASGEGLAGAVRFGFLTNTDPETNFDISPHLPEPSATNVPTNTWIEIYLSGTLNPRTLVATLTPAANLGSPIWPEIQFNGVSHRLRFKPSGLAPNTQYTLLVSGDSLTGLSLASALRLTFTTGSTADNSPPPAPILLSPDYRNGSFSSLLPLSAQEEDKPLGFYLYYGVTPEQLDRLPYLAFYNSDRVIAKLPIRRTYYVAVSMLDISGNESARSAVFEATDTTLPRVGRTYPSQNSERIQTNQPASTFFSKAMNPAQGRFQVSCTGESGCERELQSEWPIESGQQNVRLDLRPTQPWAPNSRYTISLSGYQDALGNVMPDYSWSFDSQDTISPTVSSYTPEAGNGIEINTAFVFNFSEPIVPGDVLVVILKRLSNGLHYPGRQTWSNGNRTLTFQPDGPLEYDNLYTFSLDTSRLKDPSGNLLQNNVATTIRTVRIARDVQPPLIGSGHILRSETPEGTNILNTPYTSEFVMRVGDRKLASGSRPIEYSRGFSAFRTNSIPSNAKLVSARLTITHKSTAGNPFGTIGNLLLERVALPQSTISTDPLQLRGSDFDTPALPCTTCPLAVGLNIDVDVTAFIAADWAEGKRTFSQFRLRFSGNEYSLNNTDDYLDYEVIQILRITYTYP